MTLEEVKQKLKVFDKYISNVITIMLLTALMGIILIISFIFNWYKKNIDKV